ncbi:uncharacterized protein LOC144635916 [Oculina patagonica]
MIKKLQLLLLLYLCLASHDKLVVLSCRDCTIIESGSASSGFECDFVCDGDTINMCQKHLTSWKVARIGGDTLQLYKCEGRQPQVGDRLLLFVSRAKLYNYGKYELVTVKRVSSMPDQKWSSVCQITLEKPISMPLKEDDHTCVIAQRFPTFGEVSLRNKCVLTCDEQKNGLGGILAFGARRLLIDDTSKIDMSGKGFAGGDGGDKRGGGGYGGETFICPLQQSTMGKGGDVYNAPWAKNNDGIGGGGAGDGPSGRTGYKGGPGGYNAGGGGADSTVNSDDGAAGGGGGGHFSGGGGGGGGSGCGGHDGGKGGAAGSIGTYAGGGGQSSCPGGSGGNGGKAGDWAPNKTPHCYDKSAAGGNAGSASNGGGGGDSCGNHYGGGGGGGGLQFGNTDFKSRLSYGGGGGGGGGSAFSDDPNPGGRGGNGGGLVYLQLDELTLKGTIDANGQPGQCLNKKAHRSAPGGSGAGGSVVIFTKKIHGDPKGKISASGGSPVKCAFGTGGGGGGGVGRWVVQENREQTIVHQG